MPENERMEYKKTLGQLKDGVISIASILNKHGEGELWFGIRDDGVAVGINVGEKTVRDISQAIAAHIEPKIYPEIKTVLREDAQCIRVCFSGIDKPYFAYGRAYMRVGDENRQISAKELENIFRNKNQDAMRWDNKPCDIALESLSVKKVRDFLKQAKLQWDTLHNALEKLDLMKDDKLLNAAKVFFAKKTAVKLRCAVFASTSTATILDQQDYQGDILSLIEHGQAYILRNIHLGMRLEGLYRVDVPELAVPALREALINAFCHRDYHDAEEVRVAIFKDRVEIRNPGSLFGGLTISQLHKGNVSRRRNPLIAEMLKRIQMVERWGRGMQLILDNEPKTRFREVASLFIVDFPRPSFEPDYAAKAAAINGERGIATTGMTPLEQTLTPDSPTLSGKMSGKMSGKILALIQANAEISIPQIAEHLVVTPRTIERHIASLRKQGRLKRTGPAKGGKWEIQQ
jgi:ATP-dependent DNA helicase RecG